MYKHIFWFLILLPIVCPAGVPSLELQRHVVDYINQEYGKKYTHPLPKIILVSDKELLAECLQSPPRCQCVGVEALFFKVTGEHYFGKLLLKNNFNPDKIEHRALLVHEFVHWVQYIENRIHHIDRETEAYTMQNKYREDHGLEPFHNITQWVMNECKDDVLDEKVIFFTVIIFCILVVYFFKKCLLTS